RMVEAELEAEFVQVWATQAKHDWRAARDFLSKRFGKAWGRYATQAETEFPEPRDERFRKNDPPEVIEMRDYSWQAAWHRQATQALNEAEERQKELGKEQEIMALVAGEEAAQAEDVSATQEGEGEGGEGEGGEMTLTPSPSP